MGYFTRYVKSIFKSHVYHSGLMFNDKRKRFVFIYSYDPEVGNNNVEAQHSHVARSPLMGFPSSHVYITCLYTITIALNQ